MLLPRPWLFSDVASRHKAALSQKIGAKGRGDGAVFERCNLRKPPSPGQLPPSPPKRRRGSVSLGTKLDGNSPSSPQCATARPPRRDCVFFVVPTSVGNVDQASNPMPAKASTTRQLPNATAYCPLALQPSTKHLRFDLRFSVFSDLCFDQALGTKHRRFDPFFYHQAPAIRPAFSTS